MSWPVPDYAMIRDGILRDIKNRQPAADTSTDSDVFIRASATASAVKGLYTHQTWAIRQLFVTTCDDDYLQFHTGPRGLTQKSATKASGTLALTGAPGTPVAAGLGARRPGGNLVVTTDAGVIGADGHLLLPCESVEVGAQLDAVNESVTLLAAPIGCDSSAVLNLAGGTDAESPDELRARYLDLLRTPPAGGNRHDYVTWAMSVPGVTAAYCYPLRRGLGSVDVVITSAEGAPSTALCAAVWSYIDERRPAGSRDVAVSGPDGVTVDVVALCRLTGLSAAQAETDLAAALAPVFASLRPGDGLLKQVIETVISQLPGVVDRVLLSPAANITARVDAQRVEWLVQGSVRVLPL